MSTRVGVSQLWTIAYEGTLYASPNGPVMLTGWPVVSSENSERYPRTAYQFRRRAEAFGILDKYHFRPPQKRSFWENDDCNVTLGHLGDVPADEANGVVGEL